MSDTHAIPATMTAAAARRYGSGDVVNVEELKVVKPTKDDVLVKVEASSLNALDWHFVTGTPYLLRLTNGLRRPRRIVPGADVAGTVVALGPEVTEFAIGDEVFGEIDGGGCADYVVAAAAKLVAKPPEVSFVDAAATGVAGLTAIQGLRKHADVQPGDRVLINGAAGGVGTFAVQVAKALGAHVTAVCSTRNVEMVRSLGADEVIDYTAEDFLAGDARFDVLLDNVGNREPGELLRVLHPDARYVAVSGPKENLWWGPFGFAVRMWWACKRSSQSFHHFIAAPDQDDLGDLGAWLASGAIRPAIQRTVGFDGVADGIAEIGTGHVKAKIVVVPSR